MTARRAIFLWSMLLAAAAVAQSAQAESPYKLLKKVAYASLDEGQLMLEVVVPTGKANGLGIIDVASGAGTPDRGKINDLDQARIADILCGRGYTLFIVRPGPKVKYSVLDMADHVQRAIVFVKQNADQYRVDADRLGLLSTAAGVHLICLVAVTATNETAVQAAGVYFPPTDLGAKDAQDLYLQANNSAWEQIMKQALPGVTAVPATSAAAEIDGGALDPRLKLPQVSPKAPPFLIVHGDADPLVGRGNSNLFFTAMRNSGIATDMVVKRPGREAGPTIQAEVKTLADWFDKQLTQE